MLRVLKAKYEIEDPYFALHPSISVFCFRGYHLGKGVKITLDIELILAGLVLLN